MGRAEDREETDDLYEAQFLERRGHHQDDCAAARVDRGADVRVLRLDDESADHDDDDRGDDHARQADEDRLELALQLGSVDRGAEHRDHKCHGHHSEAADCREIEGVLGQYACPQTYQDDYAPGYGRRQFCLGHI